MSIKITGLDELQRKLKNMEERARELHGEHGVPMDELFPSGFMNEYTAWSSFAEFIKAGGFKVESHEDFAAIPDDEWDAHIARSTPFANWEEMRHAAVQAWAGHKLGFN